jgi:DNA-binding transcriptional regulator LsrR (DeoR family)
VKSSRKEECNRVNFRKPNFKAGRPKSLNPEEFEKLMKIYYSSPVSIRVLAKMFNVSRMTIWRMVNET